MEEGGAVEGLVILEEERANYRAPPQVTDPVTDPVNQLLLQVANGPLSPSAIQAALGLKHRPTFRANYLYPALEGGFIEMTLPDKPASRLQKYRLTAAGRAVLLQLKSIGL
ncbi:hypothetical protein FACS1894154_06500 [Betaproteobacteria bacterium]|nr:hypothetical protein FACS1894154_06500 [Betaproteobacteria bacterium]